MRRLAPAALAVVLLGACSVAPKKPAPPPAVQARPQPAAPPTTTAATPAGRSPYAPAQEDVSKRGDYVAGGLYAPHVRDSAPDDLPDVDRIPEPVVVDEPRSRYGNRNYSVLGLPYQVLARADGYVEQGIASYYGKKFHGRRTSSLEVYDMYAFSGAHKTLPLPSYARVTRLDNGKSVVVRINDRGPFHPGRVIDLSYAAAVKLGVHRSGTARVEVRALRPGGPGGASLAAAPTATVPPPPPRDSALDRAIAALPIAAANAGERVPAAGAVVLQVASYTARDNAERALARLREAGIGDARLVAAETRGQTLWRLRVGPVDVAAAEALRSRVTGLGFGPPALVRD